MKRSVATLAIALVCSIAPATGRPSEADPVYPGKAWQKIENPGALGWSPSALDNFREQLKRTHAESVVAVYLGRVLLEYGDVAKPVFLASVRKSLLSMMYGNYVADGTIKLDATLAELGIDDVGGLSPKEKRATVLDLLRARSGVYHPAANKGDDSAQAPPRDSQEHGTYFLYNNWDFNVLGTVFEKQTGQNIYDAFERDYARPLQMQDFRRSEQVKERHDDLSIHPAYHFHISARDLARVGWLMLRQGNWEGKQLVPRDWVKETTRVVTPALDMHPPGLRKGPMGYGYLWWIWDSRWAKGAYEGAYTGHGLNGQFVTVMPALNLVVAFETPQGAGNRIVLSQYLRLLEALVNSRCRESPCK
ncbi:MAG TPA: serine hydrolase [Burkholderiaceae bacterium]|nr:serine hydrolase [Burkholderiaceae bacterium]